jgi:lathosterol oxidase
MIESWQTIEIWAGITVITGIRYFVLALLGWIVCYKLFYSRWFHRKIIQKHPTWLEIRREIIYSILSVIIFGFVGVLTIVASRYGMTQIYWQIGELGWLWFGVSILLTIFLHDTYFYWTHRIMHHKRLFHWMHRIHHKSTNPTPWASFSFGPWEAAVQAGIFPLTAVLFPIHPIAFGAFMGWQMLNNVLGHSGFEFYPRQLMSGYFGSIFNTPTNHIMHHENPRGNYGIYFNVWDRLMGTNLPDYEQRFNQVTTNPKSTSNKHLKIKTENSR